MRAYKPSELTQLKRNLSQRRWRQAILLRGEQAWCTEQLSYLQQDINEPWHVLSTNEQLNHAQWPTHLHQILGQEHSNAAYDCFSGFFADKLAALSGTVSAGGLLVIIMPEDTSHFVDPGISKLVSYGYHTPATSHFWAWLEQQLSNTQFINVCQSVSFNALRPNWPTIHSETFASAQQHQQQVIERIKAVAKGPENCPLLISADRGRGKSSALGLAAAHLSGQAIILCAIQRRAVSSAFKHLALARGLPEPDDHIHHLDNLTYMPPDRVVQEQPQCDTLFVDEAATLPIPILKTLLKMYPRVVFASTLVGYEGSGRGYTLRFKKFLDKHYPSHSESLLHIPFRFANGDPLEQGISRLLALDSACNELALTDTSVVHKKISVTELLTKPELLKQVFALLVLAHYQTSTNDFRQLLDAPGQQLFITLHKDQLVGVALVMNEGGFDKDLANQIARGQRRPQGHLLAQSLAQLAGKGAIAQLHSARIVRIAIHPDAQHLGIGTALISYIEMACKRDHFDILGTSFGAYGALVQFWQRLGFHSLKLGFKRDHVSGEHSLLMAKALSNEGDAGLGPIIKQWQRDATYILPHFFANIGSDLTAKLLSENSDIDSENDDMEPLCRFARGELAFIHAFAPLMRFTSNNPAVLEQLDEQQQRLLAQLKAKNCTQIKHKHSKKQFNLLLMALVQSVIAQRL
ncbi:GNAT family N-acetyltransferase [Pseudoalteromonas sp. YIC-656]|uniref:GNAT family N-acetyltransferase n=1 Tax=Pseudoalteromonas pernae TaxID=3118054 RepID=UPI003241EFFD